MKITLKYIGLIFLLIFCVPTANAQTDKIRSAETLLNQVIQDTSRVQVLNKLGKLFYMKSLHDSAIHYSNIALNLALRIDYLQGVASAYSNIANTYSDEGNYPAALQNYSEALEIFEKKGLKKSIASTYNNIGIIYFYQGNFPDALKNYLASLRIKRETGDTVEIENTYNNIGQIYLSLGNYHDAFSYYLIVLKTAETNKNQKLLGVSYHNIGEVYKEEGKYMQAMENEKLALDIALAINEKNLTATVYSEFGDIYIYLNKNDSAIANYFRAIKINKELNDNEGKGRIFANISRAYSAMQQYTEARKYIDSAITISKVVGDKQNIRDIYSLLVHIDSVDGKPQEIFRDYRMYISYRDSLSNEESTRKMVSEQMNYENEFRVAAAKAEQEGKASKQRIIRNVLIVGIGLAFLFAGIFFFQRKRISKEKDRSDNLLLNILPSETAEELKATGESKARNYSLVTVMFTDFKNFTQHAETMTAEELVNEINYCYKEFDKIIARHHVEKIKTMGDGYMAAGGVPHENIMNPQDTVAAAIEIQNFMLKMKTERVKQHKPYFEVRIGINSGPVVAGIVGINKFAYDIWGDTVNIAARMESGGEAGKVNISGATYEYVKDKFNCIYRGKIQAKNKGEIDMYFVEV